MKKQSKLQSAQNSFLFQAIYILSLVLVVLLFSSYETDKTSEDSIPENPIPEDQVNSGILFSTDKNGHNQLYRLQDHNETLLLK